MPSRAPTDSKSSPELISWGREWQKADVTDVLRVDILLCVGVGDIIPNASPKQDDVVPG